MSMPHGFQFALCDEVLSDKSVSHVGVVSRDRFQFALCDEVLSDEELLVSLDMRAEVSIRPLR